MVAGVENAGFGLEAEFLQRVEHEADLRVDEAQQGHVGGEGQSPFLVVAEEAVLGNEFPLRPEPWMQAFRRRVMRLRQRHLVERIEIEIFARHHEGRMRRHESDIEDPWIAALFGLGHQPFGRGIRDAAVVKIVVRDPDSDILDQTKRRIERGEGVAQRAPDHADAVNDVHRFVLPVEPKRILRAAEMHLADRLDRISSLLHLPGPTGNLPVIGVGIVPAAGLMDMTPGRERRSRRHADGARRIGIAEPGPPVGKSVQRRGMHQGMTGRSEISRIVTVAHENNEILRVHRGCHRL